MMRHIIFKAFLLTFFISGCQSASYHKAEVQNDETDRLTVGTVQKEIKVGMPASDVAKALGSPNIVTTDEERREVWIYDKIATEKVISQDSGFSWIVILGSSGTRGASSTSQRTLTIIVKFDKDQKVRDFSYHSSRF